ncbi:hypothetical protein Goshw_012553 [Gossypium schwendimanii]|uniref:PGG domain-containing protein n=1 Tax=Gossypium schwendimanii TaxID=34291 RepID=A0A7J9L2X9_GOSSC|nr:hypothetical protein [Gossypium schwendimanii]
MHGRCDASKNDHIGALNLLIGWLQRNCRGGAFDLSEKVVNWRDGYDNTVLHILQLKRNNMMRYLQCNYIIVYFAALKLLLYSNVGLHVTAKNSEGLMAREIIENVERKGLNMSGEDDDTADKIKRIKRKLDTLELILIMLIRARNGLSENMINATLVTVALVITAIYQSSLSPPRGVWQVDNNSIPTTTSNVTTTALQIFDDNYNNSRFKHLLGQESRKTGTPIMNPDLYSILVCNLLTLELPVLLTYLLLSNVPSFLLIPLYYLSVSYFYSMTLISPSSFWENVNYILTWMANLLPLRLLRLIIRPLMSPAYKEYIRLRRAVSRAILRAKKVGIIRSLLRGNLVDIILCP